MYDLIEHWLAIEESLAADLPFLPGVLQCVAVCCSVLQCVVSIEESLGDQLPGLLQCVAACCNVLR